MWVRNSPLYRKAVGTDAWASSGQERMFFSYSGTSVLWTMIFWLASVAISLSSWYSWVKNTIPFSSSYFMNKYSGIQKPRHLYTLRLIDF